jgi:BMFP domain-containing protein YqiC
MGETVTTTLFDQVQQRIVEARAKLDALDVSEDVMRAAQRQLNRLDRASRSDLTIASREVEAFHATLDAGDVPIYD